MEDAHVFATGICFGCGHTFTFNPRLVPSYQGLPICRTCIDFVNHLRGQEDRELWPVPEGAYDPAPAGEVL